MIGQWLELTFSLDKPLMQQTRNLQDIAGALHRAWMADPACYMDMKPRGSICFLLFYLGVVEKGTMGGRRDGETDLRV